MEARVLHLATVLSAALVVGRPIFLALAAAPVVRKELTRPEASRRLDPVGITCLDLATLPARARSA